MKKLILFLACLALAPVLAAAQDETTGSITPPAVTSGETSPNGSVPGENGFTEPQVRERLSQAGYTGIGWLTLDSDGVWRTTAIKQDNLVSLGVDRQGNIIEK